MSKTVTLPTHDALMGVFDNHWSEELWTKIEAERDALGHNLNDSIWNIANDAQNKAYAIIKEAEQKGITFNKVKKELAELLTEKGKANMGYNVRRLWVNQVKTDRIIAQKSVWQDMGYVQNVILFRSHIGGPCEICDVEVGEGPDAETVVPLDYGNWPPFHPWCECDARPEKPSAKSIAAFLKGEMGSPKVMALMAETNPTLTVPMPTEEELAVLKAQEDQAAIMATADQVLAEFKASEKAKIDEFIKIQGAYQPNAGSWKSALDEFTEKQGQALPSYSNFWTIEDIRNGYGDEVADKVAELRKEMAEKGITTEFDKLMTKDYMDVDEIRIFYGKEMADKVQAARDEAFIKEVAQLGIPEIREFYGNTAADKEDVRRIEARITELRERDQRAIDSIYTQAQKENVQYDSWRDFTTEKAPLLSEDMWTLADGSAFDINKEVKEQEDNRDAAVDAIDTFGRENYNLVFGEERDRYRDNGAVKDALVERITEGIHEFLPADYKDTDVYSMLLQMMETEHKSLYKGEGTRYNGQEDANTKNAIDVLVHAWAITSGSGEVVSCSAQSEVQRIFGLEKTWVTFLKDPEVATRVTDFLDKGINRTFLDAFLKTMYVQTQQFYADKGITDIVMYRGLGMKTSQVEASFGAKSAFYAGWGQVELSPLNAWSLMMETVTPFAARNGRNTNAFIMAAKVPVSRVIGSFLTGYGCMDEQEFVVMGAQQKLDTVYGALGLSGDGASAYMASYLISLSGNVYKFNPDDINDEPDD